MGPTCPLVPDKGDLGQPLCCMQRQSTGRVLGIMLSACKSFSMGKVKSELNMPNLTLSILQSERSLLCLGHSKQKNQRTSHPVGSQHGRSRKTPPRHHAPCLFSLSSSHSWYQCVVPNTFIFIILLSLLTTMDGRYYYHTQPIDEETEAVSGDQLVEREPGVVPRASYFTFFILFSIALCMSPTKE